MISTRAVVERRQQIGMMRAMGFRRSLGGAYLATLVTTWLPARQASRVAPAEAQRYE